MINLYKQELDKINSQNVEQDTKMNFFQWFKKYVIII